LAQNSITLDDLERQNMDFLWIFRAISGCDTKSFTRWRGIVGNTFRLQRSYSTPGLVMGDCLRAGTAIGFRASREH